MELKHKTENLLLSTAYLPPVEYLAWVFHSRKTIIEQWENYPKQTYRNRCIIAGAEGKLTLTVPIEKTGYGKCLIRDVRISEHGNWRHLHWNALVSAYRNTPFFEYYEDDFIPFYTKPWKYLFDFNLELLDLICSLIGFKPVVQRSDCYVPVDLLKKTAGSFEDNTKCTDLRDIINPKIKSNSGFNWIPYYQIFASRHGFQGNLSIVDLLFNMGPESLLVLRDSFKV